MVISMGTFSHNPVSLADTLRLIVSSGNEPDNKFSVISGQNYRFLGINQYFGELMFLAQGHKRLPVGFKSRYPSIKSLMY